MKPKATYPVPNCFETKSMLKMRVRKSAKSRGRSALEAIKAKLDDSHSSKDQETQDQPTQGAN